MPMELRRDPLAAAAEAIAALERRCGGGRYSDSVLDGDTPPPPLHHLMSQSHTHTLTTTLDLISVVQSCTTF